MGKGGFAHWFESLGCATQRKSDKSYDAVQSEFGGDAVFRKPCSSPSSVATQAEFPDCEDKSAQTVVDLEQSREDLVAAGNAALAKGDHLGAIEIFQQCAAKGAAGSAQQNAVLEVASAEAKAAIAKAAAAMKAAAELVVSTAAAAETAAAASKESGQGTKLVLPEADYSTMGLEDKVDVLRIHLPTRTSQDLRKVLADHSGDVHQALATAAKRA